MLENNKININSVNNSKSSTLVDTHCHVNIMIKEKFDVLLTEQNFELAAQISQQASQDCVQYILNVGTSIIECINCINLAKKSKNFTHANMFAAVGIHPCDITENWQQDLEKIENFIKFIFKIYKFNI